jgi:glycosyltransferase involved in cell wall biosynthesis
VRLKVLVVDRSPSVDLRQGAELIAANVFPRMRDVDLTLVAPVVGDPAPQRAALGSAFEAVHLVPRRSRVDALAGGLEPRLAGTWPRMPGKLGRRMDLRSTRRLDATIARLLADEAFDAVHVRQLPMASHVGATPVGRLLELIDSEALATSRGSGSRNRVRALVARRLEAAAVRSADIVTTVSPIDAEAVRDLVPGARVEVVTNGVDTDVFDPAAVGPVEALDDVVGFTGAMSFGPNIDAAVWLCREVLPRLRERRPGARIRLIGRDPSPAVLALAADDVEVTGTVDDVRPEILRCPVIAVPMVNGSGVKNKILEAMALARPIVSTTLGVESLDVEAGRDLLVADDPDAFASAVDGLLADAAERSRLAAAARAFVLDGHSWDAVAGAYRDLFAELAEVTARRRAVPA